MRLHLGVDPEEIPYAEEGSITVGTVAELLEVKFDVMQIFFNLHEQEIADLVANIQADAIDNIAAGKPVDFDHSLSAMFKIKQMFTHYINVQEHGIKLEKHKAPKKGARFKKQYKKAKKATAFYETGLYRNSFRAWLK